MSDFEKMLRDMFSSIWDCEIDHPLWQDTVGEIMTAVIQAHEKCMPELTDEQVIDYCKKKGYKIVADDYFRLVQPEPHEGGFERKRDGVFCSVCHYGWEFITGVPAEVEREYHYCPNCGAKMKGERQK